MTKHDLKELAAMGAELGAAKAENDRLRALLRELREITSAYAWDADLESRVDAALSRQPEPTDTYTAVEMATAAAQGFRDGQAATVKDSLTVQPMAYAVFADNGNVACFSTQREHPSLVAFEADGHSVVSLAPIAQTAPQGKFRMGDLVKKSTGSEWEGRVVGWYSTEQTKEGYAVESSAHRNSVQIYPAKALEAVE